MTVCKKLPTLFWSSTGRISDLSAEMFFSSDLTLLPPLQHLFIRHKFTASYKPPPPHSGRTDFKTDRENPEARQENAAYESFQHRRRPWQGRGSRSKRSMYSSTINLPEVYWPGAKKGIAWGLEWGTFNDKNVSLQALREQWRRHRSIEKAIVAREQQPSFERYLEFQRLGDKWKQDRLRWLADILPRVQINSAVKILNAQRSWITVSDVVSLINLLAEAEFKKEAVRVYKWVRVMPFYKHDPSLVDFVRTLTREHIT